MRTGRGDFKFLRGAYGAGKIFLASLALETALDLNFVVSQVVISMDTPLHKLDRVYYRLVNGLRTRGQDQAALKGLILAHGRKSLFFVESRRQAEAVQQGMEDVGITAYVHHSLVARDRRGEAEAEFAHRQNNCIVCTSTMELGIDVGDLDLVMQLDAPATVSSFMQRLGRTGRRPGTRPHIAFLAGEDMALVRAIALVNLARQGWIESVEPSHRAYHVLDHQQALGEEEFVFVLAGQRWQTVEVDLDGGLVIVRPAPKGEIPRWSGSAVLLSRKVAVLNTWSNRQRLLDVNREESMIDAPWFAISAARCGTDARPGSFQLCLPRPIKYAILIQSA